MREYFFYRSFANVSLTWVVESWRRNDCDCNYPLLLGRRRFLLGMPVICDCILKECFWAFTPVGEGNYYNYTDSAYVFIVGMMKKILTIALAVFVLASCNKEESRYNISGQIDGATEGSMVYLLRTGDSAGEMIDSVSLAADGRFAFGVQGHYYPSFYSLRFGSDYIYLAVDSLSRTHIRAKASNFGRDYSLEETDSCNRKIRQIRMLNVETSARIDSLAALFREKKLSPVEYKEKVTAEVDYLKKQYSQKYIFPNPRSAEAYYALFQDKEGLLYFDVQNPEDSRAFAAVATAYEIYYPQAPYTDKLRQLTLLGIAAIRQMRAYTGQQLALSDSVEHSALPPLKLIDKRGEAQDLADVAKTHSKLLLVFTSHEADWSPDLVQQLRRLHRKQGLEIYEVGIDRDLFFWQNAVRTLPWITVNDAKQESLYSFGVQSLPTFFIISNGQIRRIVNLQELAREG
ncbi:Uncharacterised protein [Porphyromonas crevioricanis]|uniref:DUF4369 domain-containing protein n=3 Tax=Porphyromonas crevioricanis TaxID=393921 RepID=A0A2X4PEI4_9PORP|nr:protein of unknown function [Porphyromonas crevioricanis]SQH72286.1 Uncharacterised protein [Porphyromonas crevioricanis]